MCGISPVWLLTVSGYVDVTSVLVVTLTRKDDFAPFRCVADLANLQEVATVTLTVTNLCRSSLVSYDKNMCLQ